MCKKKKKEGWEERQRGKHKRTREGGELAEGGQSRRWRDERRCDLGSDLFSLLASGCQRRRLPRWPRRHSPTAVHLTRRPESQRRVAAARSFDHPKKKKKVTHQQERRTSSSTPLSSPPGEIRRVVDCNHEVAPLFDSLLSGEHEESIKIEGYTTTNKQNNYAKCSCVCSRSLSNSLFWSVYISQL